MRRNTRALVGGAQLRPAQTAAAGLALVILLCGAGCGDRVDREPYAYAIWSDTDESWLVVRGTRERRRCSGWDCDDEVDIKRLNHELWIHPVDGREPTQLLDRRDGSLSDQYFMQSAGYVLVHRGFAWERVHLDGTVTLVDQSESFRSFVPSPDGSILARIATPRCSSACPYQIRFLDADTLEPVGPEVRHEGSSASKPVWGPEGRHLYLSDAAASVRIDLEGNIETDLEPLPCSLPAPTSSGRLSSDGRRVLVDEIGGELEITVEEEAEPGWPERCFPPEG